VIIAVILWGSLCAIAAWQARAAMYVAVGTELSVMLPELFRSARVNLGDSKEINRFIAGRLDEDLRVIPVKGWLSLLGDCRGRVLALDGVDYARPDSEEFVLTRSWPQAPTSDTLTLGLHCGLNWSALLGSQAALAVVLL